MALDKYKYVEEFIDPETHQPYENPDSPKMVTTPLGYTFLGHRIAKIKWVERKEKRKKEEMAAKIAAKKAEKAAKAKAAKAGAHASGESEASEDKASRAAHAKKPTNGEEGAR